MSPGAAPTPPVPPFGAAVAADQGSFDTTVGSNLPLLGDAGASVASDVAQQGSAKKQKLESTDAVVEAVQSVEPEQSEDADMLPAHDDNAAATAVVQAPVADVPSTATNGAANAGEGEMRKEKKRIAPMLQTQQQAAVPQ